MGQKYIYCEIQSYEAQYLIKSKLWTENGVINRTLRYELKLFTFK